MVGQQDNADSTTVGLALTMLQRLVDILQSHPPDNKLKDVAEVNDLLRGLGLVVQPHSTKKRNREPHEVRASKRSVKRVPLRDTERQENRCVYKGTVADSDLGKANPACGANRKSVVHQDATQGSNLVSHSSNRESDKFEPTELKSILEDIGAWRRDPASFWSTKSADSTALAISPSPLGRFLTAAETVEKRLNIAGIKYRFFAVAAFRIYKNHTRGDGQRVRSSSVQALCNGAQIPEMVGTFTELASVGRILEEFCMEATEAVGHPEPDLGCLFIPELPRTM